MEKNRLSIIRAFTKTEWRIDKGEKGEKELSPVQLGPVAIVWKTLDGLPL